MGCSKIDFETLFRNAISETRYISDKKIHVNICGKFRNNSVIGESGTLASCSRIVMFDQKIRVHLHCRRHVVSTGPLAGGHLI